MKPLASLPAPLARDLVGLVFDLDDTLLDRGELSQGAYAALFGLRLAGLRLVACTGRPAAWADVFARTWPIDAALGENGALGFLKTGPGRVEPWDPLEPALRAARRARLLALVSSLRAAHPELELADDAAGRVSDAAFDIAEHRAVPREVVLAASVRAHAAGARTFTSSIHLHVTFDAVDKASGTVALLARAFGADPTAALARWAFVGDSENDAPAFAAFATTFGVANVRRHLSRLTVAPRFVSELSGGAGFAEIAGHIALSRKR